MNDWRKQKFWPYEAANTPNLNDMSEIRFYGQWTEKGPSWAQEFLKPSLTIPDQSMTIAEIIAKYTRTGLVPSSYLNTDQGGNEASEIGVDPMDEWNESMVAAALAEKDQAAAASAEPAKPAETQAAEGGTE